MHDGNHPPFKRPWVRFPQHGTQQQLYLSTIASSKANKGKKGGWLPSGVVAQWQSTGGSSQGPWVRFPAVLLSQEAVNRDSHARPRCIQKVKIMTGI